MAQQVQVQLREQGIERVRTQVCGLAADEPLARMVIERVSDNQKRKMKSAFVLRLASMLLEQDRIAAFRRSDAG